MRSRTWLSSDVKPLNIQMFPDAKFPTDAQRRKLSEMMHLAFVEIRLHGFHGQAKQATDLADAFHELPVGLWQDSFSLQFFRETLVAHQKKYPVPLGLDYVAMVDKIIAMRD